jgi:hypothetical protein
VTGLPVYESDTSLKEGRRTEEGKNQETERQRHEKKKTRKTFE